MAIPAGIPHLHSSGEGCRRGGGRSSDKSACAAVGRLPLLAVELSVAVWCLPWNKCRMALLAPIPDPSENLRDWHVLEITCRRC